MYRDLCLVSQNFQCRANHRSCPVYIGLNHACFPLCFNNKSVERERHGKYLKIPPDARRQTEAESSEIPPDLNCLYDTSASRSARKIKLLYNPFVKKRLYANPL